MLIRSALAAGRTDEAIATLADAEQAADGFGMPGVRGGTKRLRAMFAAETGDGAEAERSAREAIVLFEEAGARLDAERSRAMLGTILAAANRRSEAVEALAEAERAFAELGAEELRADAARELRRLGRRSPKRAAKAGERASGELAELSARELEVAELVGRQMTNREIASELFLSEKTIESHLRNIFAKLGVSSRIAVAQAVERRRLAE